jgi:hypothetical protein
MVYLQRFGLANAPDSFRIAGAMTLLRVLPPMTPDDGQVQHAAAFGDEQGQHPIGKVVDVGGFLERSLHGGTPHHDQTVNVAGAVGVLPAAVGQTPHRDVAASLVRQRFVGVGHHCLRAGIQRIGQLRKALASYRSSGSTKDTSGRCALCIASGACFTDAARDARQTCNWIGAPSRLAIQVSRHSAGSFRVSR